MNALMAPGVSAWREHDSVHAGRQHLLEHPRIGAHRRFIDAIDRHN